MTVPVLIQLLFWVLVALGMIALSVLTLGYIAIWILIVWSDVLEGFELLTYEIRRKKKCNQ